MPVPCFKISYKKFELFKLMKSSLSPIPITFIVTSPITGLLPAQAPGCMFPILWLYTFVCWEFSSSHGHGVPYSFLRHPLLCKVYLTPQRQYAQLSFGLPAFHQLCKAYTESLPFSKQESSGDTWWNFHWRHESVKMITCHVITLSSLVAEMQNLGWVDLLLEAKWNWVGTMRMRRGKLVIWHWSMS